MKVKSRGRKAEELLKEKPKNKGGKPRSDGKPVTADDRLSELGITKDQSSNWQRMAEGKKGGYTNSCNSNLHRLPKPKKRNLVHCPLSVMGILDIFPE